MLKALVFLLVVYLVPGSDGHLHKETLLFQADSMEQCIKAKQIGDTSTKAGKNVGSARAFSTACIQMNLEPIGQGS